MKNVFKTFLLPILLLAASGWSGYVYAKINALQTKAGSLKQRHAEKKKAEKARRLSPAQKETINKRIKSVRERLSTLLQKTDKLEETLRNSVGATDETVEQQLQKVRERNRKLRDKISKLARNRIRTDQKQEKERRFRRFAKQMKRLIQKMYRNSTSSSSSEELKSNFEKEIVEEMELSDKKAEAARKVFWRMVDSMKVTLRKMKQYLESNPEPDFKKLTGEFKSFTTEVEATKTRHQEHLNRAGFSGEESRTFWRKSQKVISKTLMGRN